MWRLPLVVLLCLPCLLPMVDAGKSYRNYSDIGELSKTHASLSLSDILPTNQKTYDKNRAPKLLGQPTVVYFHVTVLSIDSINEESMTYVADIFLAQSWRDPRLRLPENMSEEYRILDVDWLHSIWRPDCFFKNAKKVTFHEMSIPNHYLWLYHDKTLLYMSKLTLVLSCAMKFESYPHDTQICSMMIESRFRLHRTGALWRLVFIVSRLVFIMTCVGWGIRVWLAIVLPDSAASAVGLSCGFFSLTVVAVRIEALRRSYPKFAAVQRYINDRRYRAGQPAAIAVRRRAFTLINRVIVGMQLFSFFNFCMHYACQLDQNPIYSYSDVMRWNYPLAVVFQVFAVPSTFTNFSVYCSTCLPLYTLLTGLQAEFTIVAQSFRGVLSRARQRATRSAAFWAAAHQELTVCIEEHRTILAHVSRMRTVSRVSLVLQYYTTLVTFAVIAFYIAICGIDATTYFVSSFSVLLFIEWYCCCHLMESLQDINERIGWILYEETWPTELRYDRRHTAAYRQLRTTIGVVMMNSRRRLHFGGLNVCELGWRTFGAMLRASYSLLMFLIEVQRLEK